MPGSRRYLVSLHVLNKGRSSSRKLRPVLKKFSAHLLLSANPCVVDSHNPADAPSTRGKTQLVKGEIVEGHNRDARRARRRQLASTSKPSTLKSQLKISKPRLQDAVLNGCIQYIGKGCFCAQALLYTAGRVQKCLSF